MTTMIDRKLRKLHSSAFSYFVAVANEGSFRGAARKLRVASSAVNRHVLLLERELGFALFERGSQSLKLTSAGQIVLRHCMVTVRGFEDALEQLDALRELRSGIVRVAASESFGAEIVPEICAKFSEAYPGIRVHVLVAESGSIIDLTARDECDVGFAFGTNIGQSRLVASFELPIGAIVGPEHPLAGRERISIRECFDYPVVIPDEKLSFRHRLDDATDLFRLGERRGIEASSPRMMLGIARMNHHVAFQTKLGLTNDLQNGSLHFIRLTDRKLKPDRFAIFASPRSEGRFAALEFASFAASALSKKFSTA